MNEIPYEWGTAVNVQQMAFGNSPATALAPASPSPRDPATGAKKLMGEYLINAQARGRRRPACALLPPSAT